MSDDPRKPAVLDLVHVRVVAARDIWCKADLDGRGVAVLVMAGTKGVVRLGSDDEANECRLAGIAVEWESVVRLQPADHDEAMQPIGPCRTTAVPFDAVTKSPGGGATLIPVEKSSSRGGRT